MARRENRKPTGWHPGNGSEVNPKQVAPGGKVKNDPEAQDKSKSGAKSGELQN